MNLEFRKPIEADSREVATWKFEGEYSFYDNDKTELKKEWALNLHKEENTYAIYNEDNELIGNCCFEFDEEGVSFGVQMKPSLTGKGMGVEVVTALLEFGREKYKFTEISLLVAKFNRRAIKVYEKLGFTVSEEFMWHVNGEDKEFYEMRKAWEE